MTADSGATSAEAAITEMTDLLVKAVRALGAGGQPEQASRIAGKAWWVLRDYPRQAERINGTMHYLARLEQGSGQAAAETREEELS